QRAWVQCEAAVGATRRGIVGYREIGAVAVGVGAVGQADVAPSGAAGQDRRGCEAAALSRARCALVTLGGPWVDQLTVVQAVGHQPAGIPQHDAAGAAREGGPPEPLAWRW